jgi:hypothetical protein
MSERSILLGVTSDCDDALSGRVFASIPFDRVELERLKERCQCFGKAKLAYPELYETYEFDCQPEWFETGTSHPYDDQSDQHKLQRLSYDAEISDGESCDESFCAELDRLDLQEINSLVIPTVELPSTGNLRTECVQLVMSLYSDGSDIVDLRWFCYLKHTDVELRTTEINSDDIDRWLAEVTQEERPEAAISLSP